MWFLRLSLLWTMLSSAWITALRRMRRGAALPSWSFAFEATVAFLRAHTRRRAGMELVALRAVQDQLAAKARGGPDLRLDDVTLGGVRCRRCEPTAAPPDAAILYLHGGGFCFGSPWTSHAALVADLARAAGMRVVAVAPRLAPEHPFPAAVDDAEAAMEALLAGGVTAENLVLAGDSSGGHVALSLQLRRRDRGVPQASAVALASPWLDLTCAGLEEAAPRDWGHVGELRRYARAYAGQLEPGADALALLDASYAELCPLLIQVGQEELVSDECRRLARRARDQGVDVQLDVVPELVHSPLALAPFHPAARAAADRFAAWCAADRSLTSTRVRPSVPPPARA